MPLYLLIEAHVFAAERLHGDDTTVPVLAKTRTDTDRIRAYVRDDRPFGSPAPPSAIFHYSRNRWGEHPVSHLRSWRGILQADAYAGYNALFHGDRLPAPLTRALCWSHARRYFFELADVAAQLKKRRKKTPVISPLAVEAVRRIDAIFNIERAINGRPVQERLAVRQELSTPLVADMEEWMRNSRSKLSKNSNVAEAMNYMLKAWPAFSAFLDDGRFSTQGYAPECSFCCVIGESDISVGRSLVAVMTVPPSTCSTAARRDSSGRRSRLAQAGSRNPDVRLQETCGQAFLVEGMFKSHIDHMRKPRRAFLERVARADTRRSKIRAHVEHVFAGQKHRMSLVVRAIGISRARIKISTANLL